MKTRSERNAEFIAKIDSLSITILRVACYKVANHLPDLNDMDFVILALKNMYEEQNDSWIIDDIAGEYNQIKGFTPDNLQIWANYRRYGNCDKPIAKSNGEFLAVAFASVNVMIDGTNYTITHDDCVTIHANCETSSGFPYCNVNYATMQKLLQIKEHMHEIARLVN